jgi:hypothetical protein
MAVTAEAEASQTELRCSLATSQVTKVLTVNTVRADRKPYATTKPRSLAYALRSSPVTAPHYAVCAAGLETISI